MAYRIGYYIGERVLAPVFAWAIFQIAKHHRPTRLMVLRWIDEKGRRQS